MEDAVPNARKRIMSPRAKGVDAVNRLIERA